MLAGGHEVPEWPGLHLCLEHRRSWWEGWWLSFLTLPLWAARSSWPGERSMEYMPASANS